MSFWDLAFYFKLFIIAAILYGIDWLLRPLKGKGR